MAVWFIKILDVVVVMVCLCVCVCVCVCRHRKREDAVEAMINQTLTLTQNFDTYSL